MDLRALVIAAWALAVPGFAAPPSGAPVLSFPLACTIGSNCEIQHYVDDQPGPGVRDYHGGRRSYEGHNGVDLRVADGEVHVGEFGVP